MKRDPDAFGRPLPENEEPGKLSQVTSKTDQMRIMPMAEPIREHPIGFTHEELLAFVAESSVDLADAEPEPALWLWKEICYCSTCGDDGTMVFALQGGGYQTRFGKAHPGSLVGKDGSELFRFQTSKSKAGQHIQLCQFDSGALVVRIEDRVVYQGVDEVQAVAAYDKAMNE